ncbi:MAG: hypothetical protein ACT4PT_06230 [Methanobacteriota archaeon]
MPCFGGIVTPKAPPRFQFALVLLIAAPLAGCLQGDDDADDGGTPPTDTSGSTTPPPAAKPPAPKGDGLTATEIATLVTAFNDQPFMGGQGSPEHVWKWVTPTTFIGLHFNNAQPLSATKLLWIVIGQKGVFCRETQPGGNTSGFTHFHKATSANWDAGHGGQAGDQGYWLLHVGVDMFEAPAWSVKPGTDYSFMPTPAPACAANVPDVDVDAPGADALSAVEIAALRAAFNEQPFQGGQGSPAHVSRWVNEEAFVFLHFNNDDVTKATGLLWFGLGTRGEFCRAKQPHADFTHFHQWTSSSWDGGHGGKARDQGYWLQHNAVTEIPQGDMMAGTGVPWGPVAVGVDRGFMPTPAPAC